MNEPTDRAARVFSSYKPKASLLLWEPSPSRFRGQTATVRESARDVFTHHVLRRAAGEEVIYCSTFGHFEFDTNGLEVEDLAARNWTQPAKHSVVITGTNRRGTDGVLDRLHWQWLALTVIALSVFGLKIFVDHAPPASFLDRAAQNSRETLVNRIMALPVGSDKRR